MSFQNRAHESFIVCATTDSTSLEVQEIQSGTSVLSENGSEPIVGSSVLGDSKTSMWNKKYTVLGTFG